MDRSKHVSFWLVVALTACFFSPLFFFSGDVSQMLAFPNYGPDYFFYPFQMCSKIWGDFHNFNKVPQPEEQVWQEADMETFCCRCQRHRAVKKSNQKTRRNIVTGANNSSEQLGAGFNVHNWRSVPPSLLPSPPPLPPPPPPLPISPSSWVDIFALCIVWIWAQVCCVCSILWTLQSQ